MSKNQIAHKMSKMTQGQRFDAIEKNIGRFTEHQEKQKALVDKITTLGPNVDIANLDLSDVDRHSAEMASSIAELVLSIDTSVTNIGNEITALQQPTWKERFVGAFSEKKAKAMSESRIRSADISDNLMNLHKKSVVVIRLLQDQLGVILEQKQAVMARMSACRTNREKTLEELQATTKAIDALIPVLTSLQDQISNENDPHARAQLETEFAAKNTEYTEAKMKEQELLSTSQTLESHIRTYEIYSNSLQTQEATQKILLNKIRNDSSENIVQWNAVVDSMKTAAVQQSAHSLNDVGTAVTQKSREMMAGIAVGAEKAMGNMMARHSQDQIHAANVKAQRDLASEEFEKLLTNILEQHRSGQYTA